jgi:hypothetical protein
MKKTAISAISSIACLGGCTSISPTTATPTAFECESIHPEVCALEKQFHILRLEQAEQNAAIQAAEQKRRAQLDRG